MTFLYPMMLWALALPLLLAVATLLKRHRSGKAWRRLVSPAHEAELVVKTPAWRSALPMVLMLFALTAGILAAARPIHGYTSTEAVASGRNLLIALDISRSMETQDVKPSRLEEARAAAFELVDALPGDKIGLIVFSGEADLVVPLTYDHTALRDALEQVNRGWAGYGGTNFGLVLKKAMQDFARSAPTGTNALVIFSDGEDTVGSSLDIAQEAKAKNLLVITVGVGTSIGDSIPDVRGENGLYQDAAGKHVISKLDTEALRRFAEATGGSYFTMGSGADLSAFARQAVEKLDKHEEVFSGHKVPRDLFAPFALAALVLLMAAILLGTEWRGSRRLAPLPLLVLIFFLPAPADAAPEAEAVRAYEEALTHMGEDADKARELFSRALLDEDTALQAACLYELGNLNAAATFNKLRSLYGQGEAPAEAEEDVAEAAAPKQPSPEQLQEIVDELGKGLQPYRDALGIRPELVQAQTNVRNIEAFIEKLREEIERLRQQQQQDSQQDEQQPQDGQQDKQDDQQPQDGQQDKQDEQQQDGQQDKQDEQQQDDQQDKQDEQQQDGQQDKQDDQQPQDGQQDKQDEQDHQQQQDKPQPPPPARPQPQQAQPAEPPMSDKEKAQQRAAGILKMHMDEEQGSPIPRANSAVRPPEKDY